MQAESALPWVLTILRVFFSPRESDGVAVRLLSSTPSVLGGTFRSIKMRMHERSVVLTAIGNGLAAPIPDLTSARAALYVL